MQVLDKPSQIKEITPKEAFAQIIAANGVYELAAERLHLIDAMGFPDVDKLIGIIASDPSNLHEIQSQIKVVTLLKSYRTFVKMQEEVETSIPFLKPDEAANAFNKLLSSVASLTQEPSSNNTQINILEVAMRSLPPHVREALELLSKAKQIESNGEIIEHDSSEEVVGFEE